jgi:hypothetical protein
MDAKDASHTGARVGFIGRENPIRPSKWKIEVASEKCGRTPARLTGLEAIEYVARTEDLFI